MSNLLLLSLLAAAPQSAPPPSQALSHIVIAANGERSTSVSGEETAAACAPFRLTPAQIARFFRDARAVDATACHHDLPMAPCQARGTARFGGRAADWSIDQARRGRITFADGSTRYVFCAACTGSHFLRLDAEDRALVRQVLRTQRAPPR